MWDVHLYRLKVFPGHAKAICQNQYIYLDRRLESEKQIKCQQATQNVFSIGRHLPEQPNIVKVTQIPRPIPIPSHANPSPGLLLLPLPVWFWPNRFTLCCRQPFSQPGCKYVQRLNVSNKARRRRTRGVLDWDWPEPSHWWTNPCGLSSSSVDISSSATHTEQKGISALNSSSLLNCQPFWENFEDGYETNLQLSILR